MSDALSITITESCAKKVANLRKQQGDDNLMLRITVSGGGCSGFQYGFDFDSALNDDDRTFERDGVTVVVDEMSLELMDGAEVDFVNDLMGAAFKINNPLATASCGCGSSFSI